jgi:hypothetical protein
MRAERASAHDDRAVRAPVPISQRLFTSSRCQRDTLTGRTDRPVHARRGSARGERPKKRPIDRIEPARAAAAIAGSPAPAEARGFCVVASGVITAPIGRPRRPATVGQAVCVSYHNGCNGCTRRSLGFAAVRSPNPKRLQTRRFSERERTGANARQSLPCRRSWVRVPSSASKRRVVRGVPLPSRPGSRPTRSERGESASAHSAASPNR